MYFSGITYPFCMSEMKKILSILLIIIVFAACRSVPFTGRKQLSLVSDASVLSLSSQQYSEFIGSARLSNNVAQRALVERVGQRLSQAVISYYTMYNMTDELRNFKWEFKLVENSMANAFCMPGGKIVVYTGILPITKDETGLAVVLGHEVAHALAKHSNERISQQIPVYLGALGLDIGLALSNKSSETRQLALNVFGLGATAGVILPFSRKHELEADQIGLIIMALAGYNPQEAPAFWQRMAATKQGTSIEFLSTHPSDQRRIAHIQSCLPKAMQYYKK